MRIVGGRLRGRALVTPDDNAVRPTSDRVREALFNILEHGIDAFDVDGAHVLDLFAGTGALGIEALSRGAAECVFVENAVASRALIQENIEVFGLGGVATIFRRSAIDLGTASRRSAYDLVFADPPYGKGLAEKAIASAIDGGWLSESAVIVIEEDVKSEIAWPNGCAEIDRRKYGNTQVVIGRYEPA